MAIKHEGKTGTLRALLSLLLLSACGEGSEPPQQPSPKARQAAAPQAPVTPPAPGEPGRLADDGTPHTEEPAEPGGAQEAATVVEAYYALIGEGKYKEAWKLRWTGREDSADAFVESFGKYASYRANVGAPSEVQGAAGSLYVEVPVQIYGRMKDGQPFSSAGSVTLRRSNNVPGSTPNERRWRIYS